MKIEFYKVSKAINGGITQVTGECSSIKDIEKEFSNFLKNHGTHFEDYNEFHCRFAND